MLKATVAVSLVAALVITPPLAAADHLVAPSVAAQAVSDAAADRVQNLATLDRFLDSKPGQQAVALLGANRTALGTRMQTLNDSDLRELAQRVEALQADPKAGLSSAGEYVLWTAVGLAVAVVIYVVINNSVSTYE